MENYRLWHIMLIVLFQLHYKLHMMILHDSILYFNKKATPIVLFCSGNLYNF